MSETMTQSVERKLWYDGVNFTADAVVIDPVKQKLLLIKRRDTGDWALPGGFIDTTDASAGYAAAREACEETGIMLDEPEALLYRGAVDDPRNTTDAWIETSAYIFYADSDETVIGGDLQEVEMVDWKQLNDLPELYASHTDIVKLGVDYLVSLRELYTPDMMDSMIPVDGGHMQYDKNFLEGGEKLVFSKAHRDENFTDADKAERSKLYLQKEADVMAHLRTKGFSAVPEYSILLDSNLLMEAFEPANDWRWRAPKDATVAHYIADTLKAFDELEALPLSSETFDIEPSYLSFRKEGWESMNERVLTTLRERAEAFYPRMNETSQVSGRQLLESIDELRREGLQPHAPERYVASHHDARQSNLAWHPDHGVRVIDWSWFGAGEPGSDATNFLIDIHKSGHDIRDYLGVMNERHCLTLIGFWLAHASWPIHTADDSVRFQQFVSAVSAYEVLKMLRGQA